MNESPNLTENSRGMAVSEKDQMYNLLWSEFVQFDHQLPEEESTELDGILWKLAGRLTKE